VSLSLFSTSHSKKEEEEEEEDLLLREAEILPNSHSQNLLQVLHTPRNIQKMYHTLPPKTSQKSR
jgi:hypothetical protein